MIKTITGERSTMSRVAWVYFAVVMLAYAAVILTANLPPTFMDFPDWVYQGVLFQHVLVGQPVAGYALKHYPVPNSLTTVGLGVLDLVLPWGWAAKAWICGYLALAGISSRVLVGALGLGEWRLIAVLPGVLFLNLNFWLGQISFEIGICLLMLLLAMLLLEVSNLWIAVVLGLMFFSHMEACAGGLLLFGLWCWQGARWRKLWAAAPTVVLTAWYSFERFANGNADGQTLKPGFRYGSSEFFVYKANTYFKTFGYVNARTSDYLSKTEAIFGRNFFLLLLAASFCISVLCLAMLVRSAVLRLSDSKQRYLGIFVLVLMFLSLGLHQVMLGTSDPGTRLLLMAVAVGLFLINWRTRAGTAVACLAVFFCMANLWQLGRIDHDPMIAGQPKDLPNAVLRFGHSELEARLPCYQHLNDGVLDLQVFPTGIFMNQKR